MGTLVDISRHILYTRAVEFVVYQAETVCGQKGGCSGAELYQRETMDKLSRIYREQFGQHFSSLGFKDHKNYFFRIIHDVVQIMALKKGHGECTIEFAVDPLCFWGGSTFSAFGGYNINMLREGKLRGWDWRLRKSAIADSLNCGAGGVVFDHIEINRIIEDMLCIAVKHLTPIFLQAVTCEAALSELKRYEEYTYGKILFLPISCSTYYFYLKTGEFERAREYLQEVLAPFAEQNGNTHRKRDEDIRRQLQMLESNDSDHLNRMIKEKESAARSYFEALL